MSDDISIKERIKDDIAAEADEPIIGDVTPREYVKKLALFVIVMALLIFAVTHGI